MMEDKLQRLGKIHLGVPMEGRPFPKAVDYFVCPSEVQVVFGEKPKKLEVMFHSDNLEEVFPTAMKWYVRSKDGTTTLACKGNYDVAQRFNFNTKQYDEITCPCEKFQLEKKCKFIGNLFFMIPQVSVGGLYQIDTSSYNSIKQLKGTMNIMIANPGVQFPFTKMILSLNPMTVTPKGQSFSTTIYTMSLEVGGIDKLESVEPNLSERKIDADELPEDLYSQEELG